MSMSNMPPMQPSDTNADEIRVLGLITFVSILVGATIAVFDAGLWLKSAGDVQTNAFTYAMAAFTLQGMSFVLYKLLMQQSLDHKASFARMDRERSRRMQGMQQQINLEATAATPGTTAVRAVQQLPNTTGADKHGRHTLAGLPEGAGQYRRNIAHDTGYLSTVGPGYLMSIMYGSGPKG